MKKYLKIFLKASVTGFMLVSQFVGAVFCLLKATSTGNWIYLLAMSICCGFFIGTISSIAARNDSM